MEEASAKRQKVDEPKPSAKWGGEWATITGAQCKERALVMVITCDDDICQYAMDYGDKSLQRATTPMCPPKRNPLNRGHGQSWVYNYLWESQANYYTEEDWTGLLSREKPVIGITCTDEWTLAWTIAFLVLCHFSVFPKDKTIYIIVGEDCRRHAGPCQWP